MTVCTLAIDGLPVSARPGETVLDLCREHGIALPTLCHLEAGKGFNPPSASDSVHSRN